MKIIHTSDWHIGKSAVEERHARQIVKGLLSRGDLDQCILAITGDVTEDGQAREWQTVEQILEPLYGRLPHLIVPGNHDCGMRGITYDPVRVTRAHNAIRKLSPLPDMDVAGLVIWDVGSWRVIGLDSQAGNADDILPPLARGEIGPAQLAALEVALHDVKPTVILLHHHPIWPDPAHVLTDAAALRGLVTRRPHVRAVLYGHQHVEAVHEDASGCKWIASGKTTDLVEGRLQYRTLDLESERLQTVTIPAP